MATFTCELGSYGAFDVMTPVLPKTEDVIRKNISPARCVARIYTFEIKGKVRAGTPADSVTALGTFLSSNVNTGTLPTFLKFKDAAGVVLPGIGDVREGTLDLWEDLELLEFELDPEAGVTQLVAGVEFFVKFRARRSFPDADGVCEYFPVRKNERDDLGRRVRRLRGTIRLGKAAAAAAAAPGLIETSAAIRALLDVGKPTGWIYTKGDSEQPFDVEYPLWPLTHLAEFESEVTRVQGITGTTAGTNDADVGERRIEEPELGIVRVIKKAEVQGATSPSSFISAQEPTDRVAADTFESLPGRHGTGEWERVEAMRANGKTTKVVRRFLTSGGERATQVVPMSAPVAPVVQTLSWEAFEVREEIIVRALAPADLADFVLPGLLPATSWLPKGGPRRGEPRVERDAKDPANRLWSLSIERDYLWVGTGSPLDDPDLKAAMFAAAAEVL